MVQELNPGKYHLEFDQLILPFETDYTKSFELILENCSKYLKLIN